MEKYKCCICGGKAEFINQTTEDLLCKDCIEIDAQIRSENDRRHRRL